MGKYSSAVVESDIIDGIYVNTVIFGEFRCTLSFPTNTESIEDLNRNCAEAADFVAMVPVIYVRDGLVKGGMDLDMANAVLDL